MSYKFSQCLAPCAQKRAQIKNFKYYKKINPVENVRKLREIFKKSKKILKVVCADGQFKTSARNLLLGNQPELDPEFRFLITQKKFLQSFQDQTCGTSITKSRLKRYLMKLEKVYLNINSNAKQFKPLLNIKEAKYITIVSIDALNTFWGSLVPRHVIPSIRISPLILQRFEKSLLFAKNIKLINILSDSYTDKNILNCIEILKRNLHFFSEKLSLDIGLGGTAFNGVQGINHLNQIIRISTAKNFIVKLKEASFTDIIAEFNDDTSSNTISFTYKEITKVYVTWSKQTHLKKDYINLPTSLQEIIWNLDCSLIQKTYSREDKGRFYQFQNLFRDFDFSGHDRLEKLELRLENIYDIRDECELLRVLRTVRKLKDLILILKKDRSSNGSFSFGGILNNFEQLNVTNFNFLDITADLHIEDMEPKQNEILKNIETYIHTGMLAPVRKMEELFKEMRALKTLSLRFITVNSNELVEFLETIFEVVKAEKLELKLKIAGEMEKKTFINTLCKILKVKTTFREINICLKECGGSLEKEDAVLIQKALQDNFRIRKLSLDFGLKSFCDFELQGDKVNMTKFSFPTKFETVFLDTLLNHIQGNMKM